MQPAKGILDAHAHTSFCLTASWPEGPLQVCVCPGAPDAGITSLTAKHICLRSPQLEGILQKLSQARYPINSKTASLPARDLKSASLARWVRNTPSFSSPQHPSLGARAEVGAWTGDLTHTDCLASVFPTGVCILQEKCVLPTASPE